MWKWIAKMFGLNIYDAAKCRMQKDDEITPRHASSTRRLPKIRFDFVEFHCRVVLFLCFFFCSVPFLIIYSIHKVFNTQTTETHSVCMGWPMWRWRTETMRADGYSSTNDEHTRAQNEFVLMIFIEFISFGCHFMIVSVPVGIWLHMAMTLINNYVEVYFRREKTGEKLLCRSKNGTELQRERDEWTREKWRFNKFWFFFRLLSGELWECVCTFFCPGSHIFHSSKHHHHRCTYLFPFVCLQRLYTNSSMFLTPNLFVDLVYVCTLLQRVYCVCVYVSSSWHSKNLLCAAFAWLFVVNTLCSFDKSSIASLQHFRCHIVQHKSDS